jgi:hypothetical protein
MPEKNGKLRRSCTFVDISQGRAPGEKEREEGVKDTTSITLPLFDGNWSCSLARASLDSLLFVARTS